jgi:prepilin-type processing-associated H-X9-DG protein
MDGQVTRQGRPRPHGVSRPAPAFTLTELLVVIGLIALLVSLMLPVIGKARAAANATACLSNVRQMGQAWMMYTAENRGRLLEYQIFTPATPDVAWHAYWPGVLDTYKVRGDALLCPAAAEPIPFNQNRGFGNVKYAWTGRYQSPGSVFRFNPTTYRDSSYGYNKYLTPVGQAAFGRGTTRITGIKPLSDVPVFIDSVYLDVEPKNASPASPASSPPNLGGENFPPLTPEHWKFLIARHGRGVNAFLADGSARWVPLEETYELSWHPGWTKYRLRLPAY